MEAAFTSFAAESTAMCHTRGMSENIRKHVVRVLSRKTGLPTSNIKESSELVASLGLDGDDASEFFEDLRRHFGTDLSALDKAWRHYFRPEPTLFSPFGSARRRALVPITVEQVVHAVERGAW